MARTMVRPDWIEKMRVKIANNELIDVTVSFPKAATWLVETLAKAGIPFKLYNIGAGVKRITTDTDVCPCCKKRLG